RADDRPRGHLDDHPEIYSVAKNRLANENRKAQMVTPWTGWHADITAAVNPPTDIFESDFDRQLYRLTLVGKPLVGVDGRPSRSIEGVPILSASEELKMLAAAE